MIMTSKIVWNMVTRLCLLMIQVYSFKTKTIIHFMPIAQEDLRNIHQWMIAIKLSINASKTKCMLFSATKSKTPSFGQSISVRKLDIEQVSTLKFLGVHIHEHLTWSVYAKHVLNKLRSGLAAVRRVKPFLNQGNTNHLISFTNGQSFAVLHLQLVLWQHNNCKQVTEYMWQITQMY